MAPSAKKRKMKETAPSSSSPMSLKLLVDTKEQRVLFAEADKKTIDFLFHLLTLPMATVVRLLSKKHMVGCIANLYRSIENLNETYIQPNLKKEALLKPKTSVGFSNHLPTFPQDPKPPEKVYYRCIGRGYAQCAMNVSDVTGAICPRCNGLMTLEMTYVAPPPPANGSGGAAEGGFVKGVVTYMVMDDLVVEPMSTISSITLLNKFSIKEVGALEENVVDLGINEAFNLLKTSLASKDVLTTVFLKTSGN